MDGGPYVKMKKTCFIIPTLDAGGIETYLLRFLGHLPQRDNVTVVVRNQKKGDLFEAYQNTGVDLRFQGLGYLNPGKFRQFYRFLKQEKFETLCDFTGNFGGLSMLAAKKAGISNRITFYRRSSHAFKKTPLRLLYANWMNRLVNRHATKILSNSLYALEVFFPYRKPDDRRFRVIPNGVDAEMFSVKENREEARQAFNIPADAFVIGHVGRYDPAKNHETMFKVARRLHEEELPVFFVFCGKGTDGVLFQEKLRENKILDITAGIGVSRNIPLLLKALNVFYFPSVTEGQPNALIEAMMAGLPVIASDIPPIREVIPRDGHPLLLPPQNISKATEVLKKLLNKKENFASHIFKKEAEQKFNWKINFELFQNELQ